MRSPMASSVVIACPHCGTRYQVPPETLGDAGRKVACAHCGEAWLAERKPDEDELFGAAEEEALDRSFESAGHPAVTQLPTALRQLLPRGEVPPPEVMRSIAEIQAAIGATSNSPEPEPAAAKSKARKPKDPLLAKRQKVVHGTLRAAQFQRLVRIGAYSVLGIVLVGGIAFRTEIARALPDMAGLYQMAGLAVNTVGLDFSDVSTLISRRGDTSVVSVTATIFGVEPRRVVVPPVVVTLLDADDKPIYQWSVKPRAPDLEPGEVIGLSTELPSPPAGATRVRLSFADGATYGRPPEPIPVSSEKAPQDGQDPDSRR